MLSEVTIRTHMVTEDQAASVLESLASDPGYIIVDTETTITDSLGDRELIGVSFSLSDGSIYYMPFGHQMGLDIGEGNLSKEWLPKLWNALERKSLVFHNAKFDLAIMEKFGFVRRGKFACTLVMSHIVDVYPPHGLKELGETRLGIEDSAEMKDLLKKVQKVGLTWHHIPPSIMAPYAANDAYLTRELYNDLMKDFWEYTTPEYFDREMRFLLCLKDIEALGLPVDRQQIKVQLNLAIERMLAIRQELGFDPAKPSQLARKLYATPPDGLGLPTRGPLGAPSKAFPNGRPTMNDRVLSTYSHPVVGLVQEYRGLGKVEGTYLRPWLTKSEADGALHPTFKMWGTITTRLSCENPNMQQIPRDSYLKDLFLPKEGYQLTEFDFDQIEYRLAAAYSKDEQVLSRLRAGEDFHTIVANQLGISRQNAKTVNYLMLYGGGKGKLGATLGITYKAAEDFWNRYQSQYPGFAQAAHNAEQAARQRREIKLWTGRKKNFKSHVEYHKAFNAAIQGGSFELVKWSMLKLQEAGVQMCNQVHDSVWVNTSNDSEREEIKHLMQDWTLDIFGVPFPVSLKRLGK